MRFAKRSAEPVIYVSLIFQGLAKPFHLRNLPADAEQDIKPITGSKPFSRNITSAHPFLRTKNFEPVHDLRRGSQKTSMENINKDFLSLTNG